MFPCSPPPRGVAVVSPSGISALFLVVRNGNMECVEMLLRRGAKPDLKTESGYTSLIIALPHLML
ncbi:Protein phosphatase 1 regulatory subunit 27 [Portunus trituberculatus]|uniref:Protein phosphatase 1 regulatory subunit 27 n=1 Tax=Portunus trituberculatus TaxID=210409 RepID=A0A5B7IBU6_PORTR|nr:Protein phosphatase 1 regulatory subunit 27 [Portunus trituberculatus]